MQPVQNLSILRALNISKEDKDEYVEFTQRRGLAVSLILIISLDLNTVVKNVCSGAWKAGRGTRILCWKFSDSRWYIPSPPDEKYHREIQGKFQLAFIIISTGLYEKYFWNNSPQIVV